MINAQNPTATSSQPPLPPAPPTVSPAATEPPSLVPAGTTIVPPGPMQFEAPVNRNSVGARLRRHWKMIVGLLVLLIVLVGAGVGYYLSQQQQDVRQQATEDPFGYWGQWRIFIGGLPDQGTIDQFQQCKLYDNPCQAGTGEDSVCTCPGYDIGSIGCPQGMTGFGPVKRTVQGKGLGCAVICGDGMKNGAEQCDDGNTVNGDACSSTCTLPQPSPSPSPSPSPLACATLTSSDTAPTVGENVTFTCGQVPGATRYEFRVTPPGGAVQPLTASGSASMPLNIASAGAYKAECRVCSATECFGWPTQTATTCAVTLAAVSIPTPSPSPSVSPTPTPSVSPTPSPTPTPSPSPTPAVGCNETCLANADCSNSNHICYSGKCRLESNPDNTSCVAAATPSPSPSVIAQAQPELPPQLPETGPREWQQAIIAGFGIILAGAALLLLL